MRGTAWLLVLAVALPPGLAAESLEERGSVVRTVGADGGVAWHVHIAGFAYDPTPLQIDPGDTVVWHNHDGVPHTATDDGDEWDTGLLFEGGTASIPFEDQASYTYHCAVHASMTASLEVGVPNEPPTVAITEPADGATVDGVVEVQGVAADLVGAVDLVEVRIDGGPWNEATGTTSWTFGWDTAAFADGDHTVEARATDDAGATSAIDARDVTVANPPTLNITAPAEDEAVQGFVTIAGDASDPGPEGGVERVEVRIDGGAWLEAEGAESWSLVWNTWLVANGAHTLEARATDGTHTSAPVARAVDVQNPPNDPPTVTFTSPAEGAGVGGEVEVRGTADDPEGALTKVEVRVDGGAWQEADGTTAWTFPWDTLAVDDGAHTLEARATDETTFTSGIALRTVSVENPPSVAITAPAPGAEVEGIVAVQGTAHDPSPAHHIERVEVRIDGGAWLEANGTTSWSYAWHTMVLLDGAHTVEARASDGALFSPLASVTVVTDNQHADLVVTAIASDGLLLSQNVTATVRNQGDEAAGAFQVSLSHRGSGGVHKAIGNASLPALAIGASATVLVSWDTLGKLGNFTVRAVADPANAVEEHDEGNNAREGPVCVPPVHDAVCLVPRIELR